MALAGAGLVGAAGPAAKPPTRAEPAGFGEAETACGRGRGFEFFKGFWEGFGEGRKPGGGAAEGGGGLRPDPGGCEKTAPTGGGQGGGYGWE